MCDTEACNYSNNGSSYFPFLLLNCTNITISKTTIRWFGILNIVQQGSYFTNRKSC